LDIFGRALRLCWPWLDWTVPDMPWVWSELPCNAKDMSLFRVATTVTVGNGSKEIFWFDRWLDGRSTKSIRCQLFLLAKCKHGFVMIEFGENHCIRSLQVITPTQQTREYIIWSLLHDFYLDLALVDTIMWNA
jgi:hypothetical protein